MSKKRPRLSKPKTTPFVAPDVPHVALSNVYKAPPSISDVRAADAYQRGISAYVTPEVFRALAALSIALVFLWAIEGLLRPLLIGLTLGALMSPLVTRLEARRIPRALGGAIALLALALVGALFSLMFLPRLVRELSELVLRVPDAIRRLLTIVEERTGLVLPQSFAALVDAFTDRFAGEWKEQIGKVLQAGSALFGEHAGEVFAGVSAIVGTVGRAVLVPIVAYFVVVEINGFAKLAYRFTPVLVQRLVLKHGPGVKGALMSLVKGQLIVSLALSIIYAVGLLISGVPLAFAIALLSGLANVIPFASGTVCVVFSALFVMLEPGLSPLGPIIGAVITATVVQGLESWVLTPRIVGEQAGLSPLAVILAVLLFGELFGFLGVLFALPVATAIGVVIRERAAEAEFPARVED